MITSGKTLTIADKQYAVCRMSDVIVAESKTGTKYWNGYVVQDEEGNFYLTSSWYNVNKKTGNSSVVQFAKPYAVKPKNVGRANETTAEEQANAEFESMVKKEVEKRNADKPLPMLAQTFIHKTEPKKSREKKIHYPAAIQRKYDGLRMLSDGEEVWSRGNKPFPEAVTAHILPFDTLGYITDGEFLLPGKHAVGDVNSAVKRFQPGISDTLYYVIYDIVAPEMTFRERNKIVAEIVHANADKRPNIKYAPTLNVEGKADVLFHHEQFVAEGFEGSIIRNWDGLYAINKRVDDVQKHKDWVTEEFEILDIIPSGGGAAAEVGKYVCKSPPAATEPTFESTATGPEDFRRYILAHKDEFIGKFAVVKYRELTKYGQPFHSNVLEVRDTPDGGF